jgi:hypothetical protein
MGSRGLGVLRDNLNHTAVLYGKSHKDWPALNLTSFLVNLCDNHKLICLARIIFGWSLY